MNRFNFSGCGAVVKLPQVRIAIYRPVGELNRIRFTGSKGSIKCCNGRGCEDPDRMGYRIGAMGSGRTQPNHIITPGIISMCWWIFEIGGASISQIPLVAPIALVGYIGEIHCSIRVHLMGGRGNKFHIGLSININRVDVGVHTSMHRSCSQGNVIDRILSC